MVYLRLRDNSAQAKKMLDFLKTLPFVDVVEKKDETPNLTTRKAMAEADNGSLKRFKTAKAVMNDLGDSHV